nr:reverse transcriptase domain-containing protein [Tanacetum cinerariifolium]
PRVPLILGRPFLWTARSLIDIHGGEMILRDGDERLTLDMRHDTSSYSNQTQKESINLINVFNNSSEDFLEDLNPTFSSHPELTSPKVQNYIFDLEGGNVLPKKLLDLDSTKDLHPPLHVNPLSDSSLKDSIDQSNLANHADNFVDSIPEMFTDEHALDYSSPPIFNEYDDDFLEVESDVKNVYDDPFDSRGEKIKESKLLIDKLDLLCDFLPSEYDSFISQDFSRVNAKPSTNNEDKPGHLAARLGCAETKVVTWDDLAFKLITLGWNVKPEIFCKNVDPRLKFESSTFTLMNNYRENGYDKKRTKSKQNRAQNGKRGKVNSQKPTKVKPDKVEDKEIKKSRKIKKGD